jgi:hypothetical protein
MFSLLQLFYFQMAHYFIIQNITKMISGAVVSPHLFKKVVVPGDVWLLIHNA